MKPADVEASKTKIVSGVEIEDRFVASLWEIISCAILLCLQIVNRGVVIVFVFVVQFLDHVTKYCCVYSIKMRVEWLVRLKPREI